mgnify:CR=1 FL=1
MALETVSTLFSTIFRIPKAILQLATGVQLKDNSGTLQVLGSDGVTLAKAQAGTPVSGNDLVTVDYADSHYGGNAASVKAYILSGTTTTVTGTDLLPAGAQVTSVAFNLATALDGTSPTISIGTTATAALFVASADVNVASPNKATYSGPPVSVGGSDVAPRVTVGGSGITTGAWQAIIYYVQTPNA